MQDVKSLPVKYQSQYYAKLGQIYWEKDKKEGVFWLNKAIENALSPKTDYQDGQEKVDVLTHLFFSFNVFEKDAALGRKLLDAITETLYDEVKTKGSDDFNAKLIYIAPGLLKTDEQLAFDLAMLSLQGKQPVINYNSIYFFEKAKNKNQDLSSRYFSRMVEVVRTGGDRNLLEGLMNINTSNLNSWLKPPFISDAQKLELLELLSLFIQKESAELYSKKGNDCYITRRYGMFYLDAYKKLLPPRAAVVEQAINICTASNIEPWKKPGYFKNRSVRTSQELLDFAKELPDKRVQTSWLYSAALRAETEMNYRFGIGILDGIEPTARIDLRTWEIIRAQITAKLVLELLKSDNFEEAKQEIKNSPPELRPDVISRVMFSLGNFKTKNKQITYDLLDQMRTDIENPDFYSDDRSKVNRFQPDHFFKLANEFYYLGYKADALSVLENYSKLQNQMSRRSLPEKDFREYFGLSFAPVFPGRFAETDYDRIYLVFGNIEPVKVRLKLRCILLHEIVNSFYIAIPSVRSN